MRKLWVIRLAEKSYFREIWIGWPSWPGVGGGMGKAGAPLYPLPKAGRLKGARARRRLRDWTRDFLGPGGGEG